MFYRLCTHTGPLDQLTGHVISSHRSREKPQHRQHKFRADCLISLPLLRWRLLQCIPTCCYCCALPLASASRIPWSGRTAVSMNTLCFLTPVSNPFRHVSWTFTLLSHVFGWLKPLSKTQCPTACIVNTNTVPSDKCEDGLGVIRWRPSQKRRAAGHNRQHVINRRLRVLPTEPKRRHFGDAIFPGRHPVITGCRY